MKKSDDLKEEVTKLIKPIIEHEAKSAFYKGKLVVVLTSKSLIFVSKKIKNAGRFTAAYIKELRNK